MKNKDKDLHIRISSSKLERLMRLARKDRRSKSQLAEIAIDNYLKLRKI